MFKLERLRLRQNIELGIKNLMLHKLRSSLTMLGIVFGVASVIAMLSIGEGASKEALEQIRKLGSRNIIITSIKPVEDRQAAATTSFMSVYGLYYEDEQRIREAFPQVVATAPIKLIRKEGRLFERALELRVVGTTPEWFELVKRRIVAGRPLLPRDIDKSSPVVVLTEYGARRLLATEETIGQLLRIGRDYFEVVGIVQSEEGGSSGIQMPDQEVDAYIPINVAKQRFGDIFTLVTSGSREMERVELHQLIVETATNEDVEPTAAGISAMLQRFHKKVDYRVDIPLALLRQAEATKRTFNIVLGSIAGISLLVGGIGIMNIMLANVTERTREIGIRRAIGAKRKQIVIQFLVETVVLSTIGGFIGILLGVAIPLAVTYLAKMPTVVTLWSLLLSVGISMSVGVIFGLYPAIRASNLDPIEALRHE
ncbi:MAG TPA: ABC transporter permease [Candidatus Hydrogenedentes bacterium]|nr:ABC transporter permease [Candidatus Hydrogenedentota bacterium]HOL75519.1 ABC transporter permease [Candidatus Hydrogenedentota bacterium]HPO86039.1 ABC transporter permease [Candidatus Hydrogenedentota bacterium]